MKKLLPLLLALLVVMQLAACGSSGGTAPEPGTQNPGQPEPAAEGARTYVYEEGGLSIQVPLTLPEEPEKTDSGILFRDPEGAWTVRFEPLSVQDAPHRVNNTTVEVERFLDFGYYQDVKIEDISVGGYAAKRLSFSRNPDWVEASMGYTASSFTEPHCLILIDYKDVVVANYGGMYIDVSAPAKSTGSIQPILDDPDVQTLLGNLQFAQPSTAKTASIPGVTVSFPIRWSVGDDGKSTLWGSMSGEQSGSLFVGSSIYSDPREAAATVTPDYRTLDYGGRSWYGGVTHVQMSSSDYYMLQLFTEFTQFHALQVKLTLTGADEAALWAFAEGQVFRGVMESIQLEPEAFQDPEKDRMDSSGFECNNVGEISAYTGSDTDITIPAVIGSNEIVGVNTDVFKDNTAIRSVTIEEGVQYIDYGAFRGCTSLETVVLPNSLTHIDSYAFENCSSLRSVQFGNNLLVIDSDAFAGCSALGDVNLPESVTRIGDAAFLGAGDGSGSFRCPAAGVVYGRSALAETRFDAVEFGPEADLSASGILGSAYVSRVVIGSGCKALGDSFLAAPIYNDETGMWHYDASPLTVELNGTEAIGEYAFRGRLGLKAVDLTGVKQMGKNAFESTGLVNIVIPGTLKEVPESAFLCCADVMTITLEEGVERVDAYAFEECGRRYPDKWSLRFFTEEEAAAYGDRIVANGSPDFDIAVSIYLPSTLQYVDEWAFSCLFINGLHLEWCTSPDALPEFHQDAFYACRHIHQFYFTQETVERCGDELDAWFSQLEDVDEPVWYYIGYEPYWSEEPVD